MKSAYRMSLPPVKLEAADPRARAVLETTKKQTGMIPNMYALMANSPGVLEAYAIGYERFRAGSGFTAVEQEVVLLTISVENGCGYCVAAHSVLSDLKSRVPREVTDAIRGRTEIPDPKLRALSAFTRAMVATHGHPAAEDVRAFLEAGYGERQILDVVLAIAVKTISNYTNHLFDTPVDPAFRGRQWTAA